MMIGPNVKKLWAIKMAKDAIPEGGGLEDGVKFVTSKEKLVAGGRDAAEWVRMALDAVRSAGEPNPYKNSSDEEIAAEILKRLEARRNAS